MPARSVHMPTRWKQWWYTAMPWLSGALFAAVLIGGITSVLTVVPLKDWTDVQGAVPKQGYGVVVSVNSTFGAKSPTQPPALASVAIEGSTVTFWTHADLKQNERVQIVYRVGKSGKVYINSIVPEKNAK